MYIESPLWLMRMVMEVYAGQQNHYEEYRNVFMGLQEGLNGQ